MSGVAVYGAGDGHVVRPLCPYKVARACLYVDSAYGDAVPSGDLYHRCGVFIQARYGPAPVLSDEWLHHS